MKPGDGIFVKAHWRFSHEYVTPMAASFLANAEGEDVKLRDPERILAFRDHLTFLEQLLRCRKEPDRACWRWPGA